MTTAAESHLIKLDIKFNFEIIVVLSVNKHEEKLYYNAIKITVPITQKPHIIENFKRIS